MHRLTAAVTPLILAFALAGCGDVSPRPSPDSYWPEGTCMLLKGDDVVVTEVESAPCSEPHTHVVLARVPIGASCPEGTDTEFEDMTNNFCFRADTELPSDAASAEATAEARSPSTDAVEYCEFAAHDASDTYSTPVVVAGAIDTDVAGLRRAAAQAITFKAGVDDPDKWPGTDGSARATLCFLDGEFEEVPGYPAPVERLVIGYIPHGWDVLDFGPTARLPIVEP